MTLYYKIIFEWELSSLHWSEITRTYIETLSKQYGIGHTDLEQMRLYLGTERRVILDEEQN